jgi:hypothetical protein
MKLLLFFHLLFAIQTTPNFINVKNFLALGNGIQDDTKAIQLALDSAKKLTNCIVYFPAGTYQVARNSISKPGCLYVSSNCTLLGDSNGKTIIQLMNHQPNFTRIVYIEKEHDVTIKNLSFYGNAPNQMVNKKVNEHLHALYINESFNVQISNCCFNQTGGDGIAIRGIGNKPSHHIKVDSCGFSNTYRDAITLGSGFMHITISHCFFDSTVKSSIHLEPERGLIGDVQIHHNSFNSCYNLSVSGFDSSHLMNNVRIENNEFVNTFIWCCRSKNVLIKSNRFLITKKLHSNAVINCIQVNDSILITNNTINNIQNYILALISTTSQVKYVSFVNNTVQTNTTCILNKGCQHLVITSNNWKVNPTHYFMDTYVTYPMKKLTISSNSFNQTIAWGKVTAFKKGKLQYLEIKSNAGLQESSIPKLSQFSLK